MRIMPWKLSSLRPAGFLPAGYLILLVLLAGCSDRTSPSQKTAGTYTFQAGKLQIEKTHTDFGKVCRGSILTDTIRILNQDTIPYTLRFSYDPELLLARLEPEQLAAGKEGQLIITLNTRTYKGYDPIWDKIRCTGQQGSQPDWLVVIKAEIEDDFSRLTEQQKTEAPVAVFPTTRHNFGTVEAGKKVHWQIPFSNRGQENLLIRHVKTTCGCTAASLSAHTIVSGETALLDIEFRTHGRHGQQHKTITVYTNDWRHPEIQLHLEGTIK